ncbi:MAG: hypothetical protein ACD_50C00019G0006 [uncultured bacterium]|nr:MAG: hypothetical protein ACD_50C00019G0006 [uncultured bacterium]OGH13291.1 MAG: hypothetical protein A2687_04065 [Candidatus Levybacteria bacterium RIFCSPHIGHO2_01_FULL_38_26]
MIESLRRRLGRDGKTEKSPAPSSNLEQIEDIAGNSGNIWHDNKGDKRDRFGAKGKEILPLVASELQKPGYFENLSIDTHYKVLRLLGSQVEKEKEVKDFREASDSSHGIIFGYISGFVEHIRTSQMKENSQRSDPNITIARHMRANSGIPWDCLREALEEIGIIERPVWRGDGEGDQFATYKKLFAQLEQERNGNKQ